MDKTVYVVGTLHRYQGTYNIDLQATATKRKLEQFKRFLKEIVCQHRIRSVAEEMSVEALQKYPHPDLPRENLYRSKSRKTSISPTSIVTGICPKTRENLVGCSSSKT